MNNIAEKFILGEQFDEPPNPNIIPPITDPMGKYWRGPDMSQVLLDDKSAVMSKAVFDELPEYSTSTPSGVYPGKSWKRNRLIFLANGSYKPTAEWFLCWFGLHPDPKFVSNHIRRILIA